MKKKAVKPSEEATSNVPLVVMWRMILASQQMLVPDMLIFRKAMVAVVALIPVPPFQRSSPLFHSTTMVTIPEQRKRMPISITMQRASDFARESSLLVRFIEFSTDVP